MRLRRMLIGLSLGVQCLVTIAAAPALADATALHMQSQPGDYIGQGKKYFYKSPGDTFSVSASPSGITATVDQSDFNNSFTVTVAPPTGGTLHDGVYEGAQRTPFRAVEAPGLEVTGEGRGCNTISGRFELFNVQTDGNGTIIGFLLEFEQHCEGAAPALFGQLQYHTKSKPLGYVSVADASVQKGDAGRSSGFAVVSLSRPAKAAVSVEYATADGTAKAGVDYVASHGSVTLPPGSTSVQVPVQILGNRQATSGLAFALDLSNPTGAPIGAGSAIVSISDANGPMTAMALNSQAGDYIGQGLTFLQTSTYTSFSTSSTATFAGITLGSPDYWTLDFAAPAGQNLTVGTYQNAQRYPFQGDAAGLSVYGAGRGCNMDTGSFTVKQVQPDGNGGLASFSTDFQQDCDGDSGLLFGSVVINAVLSQMSITDARIVNGDAVFTVTVNPVSSTPTVAFFQTMDGSAVAGKDYQAKSSTVMIPAGAGQRDVRVKLIGTPPKGVFFNGTITSPDLPVVWIPVGRAEL